MNIFTSGVWYRTGGFALVIDPAISRRVWQKRPLLEAEEPAMAVDLGKLDQDIRTPDGFMIERVTDAATMKEKHIWINLFGMGKSLGRLLMDMFSAYGLMQIQTGSITSACSMESPYHVHRHFTLRGSREFMQSSHCTQGRTDC